MEDRQMTIRYLRDRLNKVEEEELDKKIFISIKNDSSGKGKYEQVTINKEFGVHFGLCGLILEAWLEKNILRKR